MRCTRAPHVAVRPRMHMYVPPWPAQDTHARTADIPKSAGHCGSLATDWHVAVVMSGRWSTEEPVWRELAAGVGTLAALT